MVRRSSNRGSGSASHVPPREPIWSIVECFAPASKYRSCLAIYWSIGACTLKGRTSFASPRKMPPSIFLASSMKPSDPGSIRQPSLFICQSMSGWTQMTREINFEAQQGVRTDRESSRPHRARLGTVCVGRCGVSAVAGRSTRSLDVMTRASRTTLIAFVFGVLATQAAPRSVEDEVTEVVLRLRIADIASSRDGPEIYCLDGHDRPRIDAIFTRLEKTEPSLKRPTSCWLDRAAEKLVDLDTGRPAVIPWLGAVVRTSDDEVIIRSRYYIGPLNATGGLHTLKRDGGSWKQIKYQTWWVS